MTSCSATSIPDPDSLQSFTPPAASAEAVRNAAESNNTFAIELYRRLARAPGNVCASPLSIDVVLAMTYAGAAGPTREQIACVLNAKSPAAAFHPALGKLLYDVRVGPGGGLRPVHLANAVWISKDAVVEPAYIDLLERNYRTAVQPIDVTNAVQAASAMNRWLADRTGGRIHQLVDPAMLSARTRLAAANAVYFDGKWLHSFRPSASEPAAFLTTPSSRVLTPFMHQQEAFDYAETSDAQLLRLPYVGGQFSMVIVLPRRTDGLSELESSTSADDLQASIGKMSLREVQVALPRFSAQSRIDLKEILQALGMKDAFDPDKADFSAMSSEGQLFVDLMVHEATVDVDEKGTVAVAATVKLVEKKEAKASSDKPVVFRADHPFLFLIRHDPTGAILFLGRVADPSR
jgi:serpin B